MEDRTRILDELVGRMWSCAAEMLCSILNHGTDLDDVDTDVLLYFVNLVGLGVSHVVRLLRPAFQDADPEIRQAALDELTSGAFVPFDPALDGKNERIANLAHSAAHIGWEAVDRLRTLELLENDDLFRPISNAIDDLEVILVSPYPSMVYRTYDTDDRARAG